MKMDGNFTNLENKWQDKECGDLQAHLKTIMKALLD
jgi:hypothetical protein